MKNFNRIIFLFTFFFIFAAVSTYSQPVNLNENDLSFANVSTAVLVGQDGLILRTEDNGSNWSVVPSGVTNSFNASDFKTATSELIGQDTVIWSFQQGHAENSLLIIVGDNGIIMVSEDNGINWNISPSGTLENLNDVYIYSFHAIYACGNGGTLIVSTDRGLSWLPMEIDTRANLNSISFSTTPLVSTNAVIAGDSGMVLITNDNGFSWHSALTNTLNDLKTVVMADGDMMIAAGNSGTIIKSVDAGMTWESIVTDYTGIVYDLKFLNGELTDVFAASGENGVILRSENMGVNWTTIVSGSTSDLFALNFYDSQNGITVGESGTELYTIDGGLTWVSKDTVGNVASFEKKTNDVKLNQNYPNPFNPSTIISYALPFDAKVSIKVYDMLGKVVANLLTANQVSGTYSVSFNALGLSSGVYFYRLNAESGNQSFTKVMKMILTK